MAFLDAHDYEYNTYNSKDERKNSYILRGICCDTDENNIKIITTALNSYGITEFTIARYLPGYLRHHPNINNNLLYKIVVGNSTKEESLTNIRTIGYFGVKIERMHSSTVVQCRNCQRYQHTVDQCHYRYRCVQCTELHGPGHCPRKSNSNLPLGCVNCLDTKHNHTGHTANDCNNCSYFHNQIVAHKKTNPITFTSNNNNKTNINVKNNKNYVNSKMNTNQPPPNTIFPSQFADAVRNQNSNQCPVARSKSYIDTNELAAVLTQIVQPLIEIARIVTNSEQ